MAQTARPHRRCCGSTASPRLVAIHVSGRSAPARAWTIAPIEVLGAAINTADFALVVRTARQLARFQS
jgi:hypothetical protein